MIKQKYVMPDSYYGELKFPLEWPELNWLHLLPKNTYLALWVNLPSCSDRKIKLPIGRPLYVVSFHQERFDSDWILEQTQNINAPIIILCDESTYDFPLPANVYVYKFYSRHHHIDQIIQWFPEKQPRNIKYKVSNICNRVTQSKLIVFTALMEYLLREDLLVKLGDWVELKNVHDWQETGNQVLDHLTDIFKNQYLGKIIKIDEFNNQVHNIQGINSNPWQPVYTEAALHFTSESYHYSLMHTEHGQFIMPGPAFSEKTFKCLIAGTPFVPVGQFESYKHLTELGLKFDYGDIDLSWDNDPGNLTRMSSIVELIKSLRKYGIADIVEMTRDSSEHNTEHIWSGKLKKLCQEHNEKIANKILAKFK
jgi:hypothetical protein